MKARKVQRVGVKARLLQRACFFHGSWDELVESLGYTPRKLELGRGEIDELEDEEIFEFFTDQDEIVQDGVSCAGRALVKRWSIFHLHDVTDEEETELRGFFLWQEHYAYCQDCEGAWPGIYMVHDELWEAHGNGDGMLCWSCLEARVERRLTLSDLNDAPVNSEPQVLELINGGE